MNKKFVVTSTAWHGEVELMYSDETLDNKDGNMLLVLLDIRRAELSEQQHVWFLRSMPRELFGLEEKLKGSSATLTELAINVTFDMFWHRYNPPANSKKKESLNKWNRMPESERVLAYNHIAKYERNMKSWQTKMYAETYLNSYLWNN